MSIKMFIKTKTEQEKSMSTECFLSFNMSVTYKTFFKLLSDIRQFVPEHCLISGGNIQT